MAQYSDNINQALETLSAQGCLHVRGILARMAEGDVPKAIAHLSDKEVDTVYQELSEVMAVYEVCELPPPA